MPATATVAAGVEVLRLGYTAQLEGLGHVLGHGGLDALHLLLGIEEAFGDRIVQQGVPVGLELADFVVVQWFTGLLSILQAFALLNLTRLRRGLKTSN